MYETRGMKQHVQWGMKRGMKRIVTTTKLRDGADVSQIALPFVRPHVDIVELIVSPCMR